MDWSLTALLITLGWLAGMAIGMTSIGGGLIVVPGLILIGVSPSAAVSTGLFINFVTRLVASYQYCRQKTVCFSLVGALAFGSIPLAIVTLIALRLFQLNFDTQIIESVIKQLVCGMAAFMSGMGLASELAFHWKKWRIKPREPQIISHSRLEDYQANKAKSCKICRALSPLVGAIAGAAVTASGIGSGGIIVAFLASLTPIEPKFVVGTAILHGVLLTAVAVIGHIGIGSFEPLIATFVLTGAIPGVAIGGYLSLVVSSRLLKFALFIAVLAGSVRALLI
ncbi:MAG: sulfite exporter TauE/SafE family protein [Armatimonadota bacterium]|nr:sulfite exporter TauE/SafE family protein [Armatimonadota bacterium]MDW8026548.1 sulfite exporter TauE/SafE family protein [Armatimonadota bacterium]